MFIDAVPLWAFFIGIILIVVFSLELGYRLGRLAHRRSADEKESPVSVISGSILGLGAFILAFTFGIVSNRFDARKELVREEANAIRTAWQRSDFLPEPDHTETRQIIRQYLDARLAFSQSNDTGPDTVARFLADAEAVQDRLWDIAVANARKDMNSDVAALYIESLNEVFTTHASRVAVGLQLRVPTGIWFLLIVLTSLGMMSLGYQTGIAGSRRSFAQPILAVSFAMVLALIAELDRSSGDFIRVTQQPLVDLQSWISARSASEGPQVTLPASSAVPANNGDADP
jgi:hypothetical protein